MSVMDEKVKRSYAWSCGIGLSMVRQVIDAWVGGRPVRAAPSPSLSRWAFDADTHDHNLRTPGVYSENRVGRR